MSKAALITWSLTALVVLCVGVGVGIGVSVANADVTDYDANDNGILEKNEVLAVIIDYFRDELTKDEVLEVLVLYFLRSAEPEPTPTPTPSPTPTPTSYRGDVTAPELVEVTLDRTAVYVSTGSAVVRVTVRARDDLSGINSVQMTFASPSGNQSASMIERWRSTSGSSNEGVVTGTMTVPRYSEAGTWGLKNAYLTDKVGNSRRYGSSELTRLGLSVSFEVGGVAPPGTSGLRPRYEWTADNPATFEEIEAALETYRGSSLNVTSWGGAYQAAQRQAYFLPFQERFGIQLVEDSPVEYAKIRSMVASGNVTWDVVDSGTRAVYQLGATADIEELTPSIHSRYLPHFPRVTVTPWSGGGGIYWSTGFAYQKDKIDTLWGGNTPSDWTAFWDVHNFPGRRWMGRRVNENIFFAHFARTPELLDTIDGRESIASLTPRQINQSFEMLEEIKPDIGYWWTGGTDCPLGLLRDEVDMCTAWNGRIWNVQDEPGGENVHFCFECGHLVQSDVFYIPKGSAKKTLAELFISWTAEPHINARIVNYIPYRPINRQAIPLVPDNLAQLYRNSHPISPAALDRDVIVDESWLDANLHELADRMDDFLSGVSR